MILLQVQQVARFFGSDVLFENVSMEIHSADRIGLVGRNGAGKSTLLKIIAEIERPDSGAIHKSKNQTIGYLAQNSGLNSEQNVYQEMLQAFEKVRSMEQKMRDLELEMSHFTPSNPKYASILNQYDQIQHDFKELGGYGYEAEIRSVLHGFSFGEEYYDKRISTLSGGQKTRLALAKMLLVKPDLLILDEPTNHLDVATLTWLENYLTNYSGALLIVSHDRYFLDKVTQQTYELSQRALRHFHGNYSKYLAQRAQLYETEKKNYEKQQNEIAKLEDFVARNLARASTTKRAQSRRKQLEKINRLDKPILDEKSVSFRFPIDKESGQVVLNLEHAALGYDGQILSEPVQLDIRKWDAIGLVGENGVGKSTLLKSIIGKIPFIKGNLQLGTNVSIGYYDQEQAHLAGNKTVLQEIWDEHPTVAEKEIRNLLGGFLFSGTDVEKTIPLLSGGEKARVALAKLSMNHENFLLLDEPTNHLDIDNKEVLENALIDYEGTLLFISHDRYFINRVATKIVELTAEGTTLYHGDYDYYLEKKKELEQLEAIQNEKTATRPPLENNANQAAYKQSKEKQKTIRKQERLVEQLEQEMHQLETTLHHLHKKMEEASQKNHLDELTQLDQEVKEIRQFLEEKLEEWTIASEELETLQ